MGAPQFPVAPPVGIAKALPQQQAREQSEMSTHFGRGVSRTTRGTFVRRNLRTRIPSHGFSGTAYVAGIEYTGLNSDNTKPYVRIRVAEGLVEENAGPLPDPFPPGEEWYPKRTTYGDIHVPRFG